MLGSYSRGEFDAEGYIEENTALQKALIEPMGAATLKVAERIADPSSEEFPVARAVMGGGGFRATGCSSTPGGGGTVSPLTGIKIFGNNTERTNAKPQHIWADSNTSYLMSAKDQNDTGLSVSWSMEGGYGTISSVGTLKGTGSYGTGKIVATAQGVTNKVPVIAIKRGPKTVGILNQGSYMYKGPATNSSYYSEWFSAGTELNIEGEYGNWWYVGEGKAPDGTALFPQPWMFVDKSKVTVRQVELKNGSNIVQGFAAGTTWCYSFEINSAETSHNLYRYNMNNGTLPQMTPSMPPGQVGPPAIPALGHANDIALDSRTINGVEHYYIYVIAWSSANSYVTQAIVKLE